LLRHTLDRLGLQETAIIGPTADNSYQGLGDNPARMRRIIWEGVVAVDLLQKLLHGHRPYTLDAGAADAAYAQNLAAVVAATEAGGGGRLVTAMEQAAASFSALAVERHQRRPLIGIVGEIYLRHNRHSNLEIIRRVEELGGEVDLASMSEWFYYTNWDYNQDSWLLGRRLDWARMTVVDRYQRMIERRLARPLAHLLHEAVEVPINKLMRQLRPYYSTALANECLLSMGRAIELARLGVSGVINVMPFSCMPGMITAGMAPRLRADLGDLPWLDLAFDAQAATNITTRLEAFMYQASEFQRSHIGPRADALSSA
jgi:predicted nucleotide-binding protein (sugar kinase/HSP70/actin superfamily)